MDMDLWASRNPRELLTLSNSRNGGRGANIEPAGIGDGPPDRTSSSWSRLGSWGKLKASEIKEYIVCGRFVDSPEPQAVYITDEGLLVVARFLNEGSWSQPGLDPENDDGRVEELCRIRCTDYISIDVVPGKYLGTADDIFVTFRGGGWVVLRCVLNQSTGSYRLLKMSYGGTSAFTQSPGKQLRPSKLMALQNLPGTFRIVTLISEDCKFWVCILKRDNQGLYTVTETQVDPPRQGSRFSRLDCKDVGLIVQLGYDDVVVSDGLSLLACTRNATNLSFEQWFILQTRSDRPDELSCTQSGVVDAGYMQVVSMTNKRFLDPGVSEAVVLAFVYRNRISLISHHERLCSGPFSQLYLENFVENDEDKNLEILSATRFQVPSHQNALLLLRSDNTLCRVLIREEGQNFRLFCKRLDVTGFPECFRPVDGRMTYGKEPEPLSYSGGPMRPFPNQKTVLIWGVSGDVCIADVDSMGGYATLYPVRHKGDIRDMVSSVDPSNGSTIVFTCCGSGDMHEESKEPIEWNAQTIMSMSGSVSRIRVGFDLIPNVSSSENLPDNCSILVAATFRGSWKRIMFIRTGPESEAHLAFVDDPNHGLQPISVPFDNLVKDEITLGAGALSCGAFVQITKHRVQILSNRPAEQFSSSLSFPGGATCSICSIHDGTDRLLICTGQEDMFLYKMERNADEFSGRVLAKRKLPGEASAVAFGPKNFLEQNGVLALVATWFSEELLIYDGADLSPLRVVNVPGCKVIKSIVMQWWTEPSKGKGGFSILCTGNNGSVARIVMKQSHHDAVTELRKSLPKSVISESAVLQIGASELVVIQLSRTRCYLYSPGSPGVILCNEGRTSYVNTTVSSACHWGLASGKICWVSTDGRLCFGDLSSVESVAINSRTLEGLLPKKLFASRASNCLLLCATRAFEGMESVSIIDQSTLEETDVVTLGYKSAYFDAAELYIPSNSSALRPLSTVCLLVASSDEVYHIGVVQLPSQDECSGLELKLQYTLPYSCSAIATAGEGLLLLGTEFGVALWKFEASSEGEVSAVERSSLHGPWIMAISTVELEDNGGLLAACIHAHTNLMLLMIVDGEIIGQRSITLNTYQFPYLCSLPSSVYPGCLLFCSERRVRLLFGRVVERSLALHQNHHSIEVPPSFTTGDIIVELGVREIPGGSHFFVPLVIQARKPGEKDHVLIDSGNICLSILGVMRNGSMGLYSAIIERSSH
ncbi:hypothetical protein NDN08_002336 [Rhodosorus marinus]|uniref:DNA damage-binding protein 1 n=1 Tax=Rhodosorus marinus TaxID=101924 RepID=A0AAV8UZ68_9RHOD|nr:hypothetical protein NDN08_002336 [Rhodosorus marinus]